MDSAYMLIQNEDPFEPQGNKTVLLDGKSRSPRISNFNFVETQTTSDRMGITSSQQGWQTPNPPTDDDEECKDVPKF